jgi:phage tail P2-like protein
MPDYADTITSYKDVAGPLALTQDPQFAAILEVFRAAWQEFLGELPKISSRNNINTLPEIYLDLIAVEMRVPGYDQSFAIDVKRSMVKNAIPIHQRLGTPYAVKNILNLAFDYATLQEWWQFGGAPCTFQITTTDPLVDPVRLSLFNFLLNSTKNVRSQLARIISFLTTTGMEYHGGRVCSYGRDILTI